MMAQSSTMSQPAPVVRAMTKSASPMSSRTTAALGTMIGRGRPPCFIARAPVVTGAGRAPRRGLPARARVRSDEAAGIAQHEAMGQHRCREARDVVGDDVLAPVEHGVRLGGMQERERCARARADRDVTVGPRRVRERDGVVGDFGCAVHRSHRGDRVARARRDR